MFPKPWCECGGKIRVVDVRVPYKDFRVHRRHRCLRCGLTYRTVEVRLEEFKCVKHILDASKQPETMK
jgi:transcriptional regulator NrdR family protein